MSQLYIPWVFLVVVLPVWAGDSCNMDIIKMENLVKLTEEQGAALAECKIFNEALNRSNQELTRTVLQVAAEVNQIKADVQTLNKTEEVVAFHTMLGSYSSLTVGDPIKFTQVLMNVGNGYDSATGTFTVPPGGAGLYYFTTYILVDMGDWAWLDMTVNGERICRAHEDQNHNGADDYAQAGCSGLAQLEEGDMVYVKYEAGPSNTPLGSSLYSSGFSGFRVKLTTQ